MIVSEAVETMGNYHSRSVAWAFVEDQLGNAGRVARLKSTNHGHRRQNQAASGDMVAQLLDRLQ